MKVLRSKKWPALTLAAVLAAGGSTTYYVLAAGKETKTEEVQYTEYKVARGNIRTSISGTSQFQAQSVQDITIPADGTIKTMNLTRSMAVKKGDILLEIANPTLEANLKNAEAQLSKLERELADLQAQQGSMTIKAPISGTITFANNIDTGSSVNKQTKIGSVADASTVTVKLPVLLEEASQLAAGDTVELDVTGYLLTRTGTIRDIGSQPKAAANGARVLEITVAAENDGSLAAGMDVTGKISKNGVEIVSQASGKLEVAQTVSVFSKASGTIEQLLFKNGDRVEAGQTIAKLANPTLADEILAKQADVERQRAAVEEQRAKLAELTVTAPFDGVFSSDFADQKKNVLASYPVGAKATAGTTLGAVASENSLTLAIQVDELDMPQVKQGLKAVVTVEALPGRVFEGEVTQVSTVGVTTNGVTYYDAMLTVQNSQTNELKYGMTATAEVLIQDKQNVLVVPIEALQSQRGNRFVSIKKADGTIEEQHPVKIGQRSKTMVEITEGLSEGDIVVIPQRRTAQNLSQQQINQLRQQFGGGAGGAVQISPEMIQQFQQQRQQGGGGGGTGGFQGGAGSGRSGGGSGSGAGGSGSGAGAGAARGGGQ
ncbi:efflux RND transporter periplasmic adaptor subunit [Paenibacillus thermoaerophilus]|uniref:Efflux RND transporter periplasmic adaptor subunit n=1 Tax=Paenibacillus thermoaerophilus TaxID=1215385 RepID=A0ABW2V4T4_9BACL|nr:efflux RND transporter periplasmic adaptor subunit [Paenibacillus thermoaerophilus]